ncbi:MAG: metallophosphoesterase [Bacillota bacterium]
MIRNKAFQTALAVVVLVVISLATMPQCDAKSWSFALISDTHDCEKVNTLTGVTPALPPILRFIVSQKPDFVIETGDLITGVLTKSTSPVYEKYSKQYANYMATVAILAENNIPLYVIRGNHDYGKDNRDPNCYYAYMNIVANKMPLTGPEAEKGLTYSFVHNGAKFILADQFVNGKDRMPTLNIDWIKTEVNSGKNEKYLFVFGHSPMYTPDDMESKHHWNMFQQQSLRDELWKTLVNAGNVVAYISGHKHLYCRGVVEGIPQLVIGDLGTLESFNPKDADKIITDLSPQASVASADNHPGCMIITINDNNTITAAEYWLYGNNVQLHDEFKLNSNN